MLVFFHHPKGSTIIEDKRVYGFLEPYEPARISWAAYVANKGNVIQASYDRRLLERMFPGKTFPDISFTYHQIRFLDWQQMCNLCKAFGFTTNRSTASRRRKLRKFMKENC